MDLINVTLATHNEGKAEEFRCLLPEVSLHTLASLGLPSPRETGQTYEMNARIKAKAAHRAVGGYVLADDSGLSIDALDGAPGLYSARFAGPYASYDDKIEAIWALLRGVPPERWTAHFTCALVWMDPDGRDKTFVGRIDGRILPERRGAYGFGFDPIFYVPEYGQTTAEMMPSIKNRISHRGRAVAALKTYLAERILKGRTQ